MTAYISTFIGIIVFCLIVIVLQGYGTVNDTIRGRLENIAAVHTEVVADEEMEKPLNERFIKPILSYLTRILSRFLPSDDDNKKSEELRKKLRQAGITVLISEYTAIRFIAIIGTAAVFFLVGIFLKQSNLIKLLMPIFGAYAAFAVLRFDLESRITKRRELIERQMPDVFDMISVNVEAGLGFEQSILHVMKHFEGPLIDELTITYREMSMGRSRRDALQILGERCDIDDMKTFTGAVIQAGKMGISLKNVLRAQSAAIRQNRKAKVEEKAMKISVKMLLPMVLFIFPVIFIVLMGPAVIRIMEMFK